MSSLEWLREHRELQYLRAASRERRFGTRPVRRRRRYANLRWQKLQAVNPRFRANHRRTGPKVHHPRERLQELS
jgi:hypothetical protein